MDDNDDIYKTPPKKQKTSKKTFKTEWMELSEFKTWLYAVQDDCTKARCKACQVKTHF